MKHVALYIRVSTQDKQVKGMESQEEAIKMYCHNHGFSDYKIYRDAESGKNLNRTQFKQLQHDIFLGKISNVIVWKLDRISRSLRDGINVLADWLEMGVRVISVSQQFDFSGSVGKLIASVLLAVAEMERQNIRENIIRGMQVAKAKGVKIGGSKPKIAPQDVLPLYEQGLSITEISKKLKCSRQTVYTALQRQ